MPTQTRNVGNGGGGGGMCRRTTSGQGTALSAWGSRTAGTHVVCLREKVFKKSLPQATILPACTAVHSPLHGAIRLLAGLSQPGVETMP